MMTVSSLEPELPDDDESAAAGSAVVVIAQDLCDQGLTLTPGSAL
jgi:hypothetical protein